MSIGFGTWRLLLALLVAVSHLFSGMLPGPAAFAVWGFFVLSGYLMTLVLVEKYGFDRQGLLRYARHRFLRIYPGFWLACILGMATLWWLESRGVDARKLNPSFGLPQSAAEWGFIATLVPAFPRWNAPVPVANALSIEVGCYLLMPLLASHRAAATAALAIGALVAADHGLSVESFGPRYAWFLPCIPAFALGSLVYHARRSLQPFASPMLSIGAWLTHCLVVVIWHDWPWTYGLYVSTLLSAWVVISLATVKGSALDERLGELSYPCYLLHSTAGAVLLAWFGYDRTILFATAALALTFATSWLMVRWVDRPLARFRSAASSAEQCSHRSGRDHETMSASAVTHQMRSSSCRN